MSYEEDYCGVCYDSLENSVCIKECGHRLCRTCYVDYLRSELKTRAVVETTCPEAGCKLVMPEQMFRDLLTP